MIDESLVVLSISPRKVPKKNARDYPLPKKIIAFTILTQREGAMG